MSDKPLPRLIPFGKLIPMRRPPTREELLAKESEEHKRRRKEAGRRLLAALSEQWESGECEDFVFCGVNATGYFSGFTQPEDLIGRLAMLEAARLDWQTSFVADQIVQLEDLDDPDDAG